MEENGYPKLQLAIDVFSLPEALDIIERTYPAVDIIELGTPLILSEGLRVVEISKERFPDTEYLVDLKLMDGGYDISAAAFRRGADIVTVLALADNRTISFAIKAARDLNKKIMVDMINEGNLVARAMELEALGVPILCLHTPYDRRDEDDNPLATVEMVRPHVRCLLAIAGGIRLEHVQEAVGAGADIIVVGGGIISSNNQRRMAEEMKNAMRRFGGGC
jgi:3-hexulose-6-phosphate synthase